MDNTKRNDFINALKETANRGIREASDKDCEIILKYIDLFIMCMNDKTMTETEKDFMKNTSIKLIFNHDLTDRKEALIHGTLSLIDDLHISSRFFAYILNSYMSSNCKYRELTEYKFHAKDHFDIIKSCKTIERCIYLVYRICESRIDDKFYIDYVKNVREFRGNFCNHYMMRTILDTIIKEVNFLSKYDFGMYVGDKLTNIYGYILIELSDCSESLREYEGEIMEFIANTGIKNYRDAAYNALTNSLSDHESTVAEMIRKHI